MLHHNDPPSQAHLNNDRNTHQKSVTPGLPTWNFRLWLDQARRLYRTPEQQHLALLAHLTIMMRHAPSVSRWVIWHDLAVQIEEGL